MKLILLKKKKKVTDFDDTVKKVFEKIDEIAWRKKDE